MNQDSIKKDIFTSMAQGFDEIHNTIEQSTPAYTQSISNLQQEYLATWKNIICSNISSQKEYAKKMGLSAESTEVVSEIIQKMTDEMVKSFKIQNQVIQTWLDTSKENIQRINDNSTTFVDANKKFMGLFTKVWNF